MVFYIASLATGKLADQLTVNPGFGASHCHGASQWFYPRRFQTASDVVMSMRASAIQHFYG